MRVVVALVPLLAGGVIAAVLLGSGDRRELLLGGPLWAAAGIAGIVGSLLALALVLVLSSRRRQARHIADAVARGRDDERASHRRFLARLDHELKNPVTAIRATIAGIDPDSASAAAIAVVDDQARRLAALVGDLRELAELETLDIDRELVDLDLVVRDAVAAVAQQRPEAAGRIIVTVDRVPWPIPELLADPDLLGLAIENVVGNAAKFSTDGPVEVRLREDGGHAVIEVADTGRGVPLDAVEGVWDELARAGNARDVPGSGIGLALVRAIVRQHGGSVALRSVEGAGTVVTLRIPVAR